VPMLPAPVADSPLAAPQALLRRLDVDRQLPTSARRALMREAEEVKAGGKWVNLS
jgi:hypothetical protein